MAMMPSVHCKREMFDITSNLNSLQRAFELFNFRDGSEQFSLDICFIQEGKQCGIKSRSTQHSEQMNADKVIGLIPNQASGQMD